SADGPFPCAVIVSTFGPHDRDGLTLTHKQLPYLRLSDALVRAGYAVLTIDERGMKRSEGNFDLATTADFARDINLAIHEVKRIATIDQDRIGIIGHGEGAVVAALVSAIDHHRLAFIATLGGPVDFGQSTLLFQQGQAMTLADEHDQVKRANLQINRGIIDAIRNDIGETEIRDTLAAELERHRKGLAPETLATLPPLEEEVAQRLAPFMTPWTRYWVKLNVPAMFEQVPCPIYAAYGSLDRQVDPTANATLMENLRDKRSMDIKVRRYDGLNHLFQEAVTGDVNEYRNLGEPFVDPVISDLIQWMNLVTRR
ncbi:MAG: alpha/beta fold hydrolase, partial [Gammaproteobacteria bacterium]|nr:alpha/beta fold hydrolase [Gammaproteobacteria bacterium]